MRYVLINPQDGKEPGYMAVAPDYVAKPGEFVVSEVPQGWVWDAASQKLRPRTAAEALTKAKKEKKDELEGRAAVDMTNVRPSTTRAGCTLL